LNKVLIFGTGFIATNLIKYFRKKDIECIVLYNKHKILNYPDTNQYRMSIDIKKLFEMEKPDNIILLHGNSSVSENISVSTSVNDNMLKIASFLEKLYSIKLYKHIKKIIVVGSASEYGKFYNKPIKEDFTLHPTSLYGLSKICLYKSFTYFIEKGLPIIYIRQFNTIGMGQRDDFVLASFAKNINLIEKKLIDPILNVGDLSQERDFIDIRDTCRAYHLLFKNGIIGEIYNIASGEYITIKSLLTEVIKQSSLTDENIEINENISLFSKEESLSKRLHADITKLKELGFKRKYSLKDTVKDTLKYWEKECLIAEK
jgi:GDP-4-dehydro-6-deoxy-D-mannose reductase